MKKRGTEEGLLNRNKWMPCLSLFFEKIKDFLGNILEGYYDYLESLKSYKN